MWPASSGVTSGGGTCLSWGRFGGGCWALLKTDLFLPFFGISEASSAHPSFIPGPWDEALVTFPSSKALPAVYVASWGGPGDNLTWKKSKSFRTSFGVTGVANTLSYLSASSFPS